MTQQSKPRNFEGRAEMALPKPDGMDEQTYNQILDDLAAEFDETCVHLREKYLARLADAMTTDEN